METNVESFLNSSAAFFVLASLSLLLLFFAYFSVPYWKVRHVPGPPARFIVGHLPYLASHGPDVLRAFAKSHGPIFRFHMGRQPLVIVADAELCREVGIKNFKYIRNRSRLSPTSGSDLLQNGLFLTRDSRWNITRNLITALYQPTHLAGLIPTMNHYVAAFSAAVSHFHRLREDVPISDLALRLAIDVLGKTAFGIDFKLLSDPTISGVSDANGDGDEASAFLKEHTYSVSSLKMDLSSSFSTMLGLIAPVLQIPSRQILKRIPGTADHKLERTHQRLCARLDSIIARRSRELGPGEPKDFLTALLNARRQPGTPAAELLTEGHVRALAYEHLVAGTKTTAFTLAMTVYLVSCHLEVERRLVAEIDRFGAKSSVPTSEDLQSKFPYLDQVIDFKVIKESMRMYTVSPLVARETSQQVKIGGYVLPKGTWVWLALGVVAKDSKQFPAPDVFRPERFDPTCEEEKQRHPYAHIPFGIGPRSCIGQKFSIQELKLALIELYRHFIFRPSPMMDSSPEFEYGLVLGFKRCVKLRAIKRTDSERKK
ncbi:cytochrome P450 711A1-like isoform X1 [Zingiber officinale]|uniref:cytochrome P450 711A1-like isoform X1 n=1 Tax=Zingiber officinale TaxID=94328 RepID=UPI001C4D1BF2|nr:cytochrome P450 711A1-like isoform X1 [Zingiber officinale]